MPNPRKKTLPRVMLGADPELFVKTREGKTIPICGIVGGSKDAPKTFEGFVTGPNGSFAYQEDGCAFEFNVPAATTYDGMHSNMVTAAKLTRNLLHEKQLLPVVTPFADFTPDYLEFPGAKVIGCSPDLDAYADSTGAKQREPLRIEQFGNRRFAGGHLHLGYDKTKVPPFAMARFLDVLIGLPTLSRDKQGVRRKFYGLAGLYREKPYGIEYRTPSNFWVKPYFETDVNKHGANFCYNMFGQLYDLGYVANTAPEVLADAFKVIPWADVKIAIEQENKKVGKEIWDFAYNLAKLPCRFSSYLWREDRDQ